MRGRFDRGRRVQRGGDARSFSCFCSLVCMGLPFLALGLLVSGCGTDRPETVRVDGRVTLDGGDWPASGLILFTPVQPAEGFPRRAGRGVFDRQGHFRVTTYVEGDGLMPGTYHAAIHCGEPVADVDAPAKSYVPPKYQNAAQSGLHLDVEPGSGRVHVEYDIASGS